MGANGGTKLLISWPRSKERGFPPTPHLLPVVLSLGPITHETISHVTQLGLRLTLVPRLPLNS